MILLDFLIVLKILLYIVLFIESFSFSQNIFTRSNKISLTIIVFASFVTLSKNLLLSWYLLVKINFIKISLQKYSHIVFNKESLVSIFTTGLINLLKIISKVLLNSSFPSSPIYSCVDWIDFIKSSIIDSINTCFILSS